MKGRHLAYVAFFAAIVTWVPAIAADASSGKPPEGGISTMALVAFAGMFLSMMGTVIALVTVMLKLARDRQTFGERMGTIEQKLRTADEKHDKHDGTGESVHRIEVTLAGIGQRLDNMDARIIQAIALEEVRTRDRDAD